MRAQHVFQCVKVSAVHSVGAGEPTTRKGTEKRSSRSKRQRRGKRQWRASFSPGWPQSSSGSKSRRNGGRRTYGSELMMS